MRPLLAALFLAQSALFAAAPAAAQKAQEITLPAGQPWVHKHSGLSVPPVLEGLPRTRITALEPDQLDEYVNFESADGGTALTIYVYRHVTGSIPVWFDRAQWAIEKRGTFGTPEPLAPAAAFIPPHQSSASGLAITYSTTNEPYRSTAVAMLPLGAEWIVKIRYSSATLNAPQLRTHMDAVMKAIDWPANLPPQPTATPVAACPTPLSFKSKVKVLPPNTTETLIGAALAGARPNAGSPGAPVLWCKDADTLGGLPSAGLFRPDASADSYLIALNDAGRGISVTPNVAALFDKTAKPGWSVALVQMRQTVNFPPVDGLPDPGQLFHMLQTTKPVSAADTWGGKTITLGVGAQ